MKINSPEDLEEFEHLQAENEQLRNALMKAIRLLRWHPGNESCIKNWLMLLELVPKPTTPGSDDD